MTLQELINQNPPYKAEYKAEVQNVTASFGGFSHKVGHMTNYTVSLHFKGTHSAMQDLARIAEFSTRESRNPDIFFQYKNKEYQVISWRFETWESVSGDSGIEELSLIFNADYVIESLLSFYKDFEDFYNEQDNQ